MWEKTHHLVCFHFELNIFQLIVWIRTCAYLSFKLSNNLRNRPLRVEHSNRQPETRIVSRRMPSMFGNNVLRMWRVLLFISDRQSLVCINNDNNNKSTYKAQIIQAAYALKSLKRVYVLALHPRLDLWPATTASYRKPVCIHAWPIFTVNVSVVYPRLLNSMFLLVPCHVRPYCFWHI